MADFTLTVQACDQIQAVDNVALTQKHMLTVQDAYQEQDGIQGGTGIFYPTESADDGYINSWYYYPSADYITIGKSGTTNGDTFNTFLRARLVTIPQGSTITTAFVRFTAYASLSGNTTKHIIYGHDVDNAPNILTDEVGGVTDFFYCPKTTANVTWNGIESWVDGNTYDTPELSTIIQEIINRAGWESGNNLQILFKDNGSSNNAYRRASSLEYSGGSEKSELHIVYKHPIKLNLHLAPQAADQLHTVDAIGTLNVAAVKTTTTLYPVVSNDDGTDTDNTLTNNAVSLIMGHYGGYSTSIFVRFPEINIERLQQVTNAFIRFTAYGAASGITCRLRIYAVDADDANAPTNDTEWDALTQTTAYVDWTPGVWVDDTTYDTPNIASVLQEVVNRTGWTALNAIVIQVLDNSSDAGAYRRSSSLDYNSGAQKPELHLTWISMGDTLTQTVDGDLVLVENATLVPAETYHSQAVDNIAAMFVGINLTPASCDHLQTVDATTLVVDLVVASCDHLHTVDDINQTLRSVGIQAADQLQTVDGSIALTQKHVLTVQGSDHLFTSEGQIGPYLVPAGADQLHTVDGITGTLIWVHPDHNEPYHIQAVDSPALTQKHLLAGISADQLQTVDNVDVQHLVVSQDAYHTLVADSIALTQKHTLVVQEAYHLQVPDYGIKLKWALNISEVASIWENLDWQWLVTATESIETTEVVTPEMGWKIKEYLDASESVSTIWHGTVTVEELLNVWGTVFICEVFNETASETLEITDTTSFVHQMFNTVAESLGVTEVLTPELTLNPLITEALGIAAAVTAIRTIYFSNAESIEATDSALWQWDQTVAESLETTESLSLAFYAILALTESIEVTESVLNTLQVDETLAEALEIVASLTSQFKFNLSIEEGLSIGLSVLLDNEVWQCWVLTSNAFHPSVYSGFEFNSYAVFSNTAYACKSDGIYELTGSTDGGTAIKAGIVLPETYFGIQNTKRFRKAFFGLTGGTTPSLRVETDSGETTYTITSSRANVGRDMYGKQWILKVQDFQELDFIELAPVILTR